MRTSSANLILRSPDTVAHTFYRLKPNSVSTSCFVPRQITHLRCWEEVLLLRPRSWLSRFHLNHFTRASLQLHVHVCKAHETFSSRRCRNLALLLAYVSRRLQRNPRNQHQPSPCPKRRPRARPLRVARPTAARRRKVSPAIVLRPLSLLTLSFRSQHAQARSFRLHVLRQRAT